MRNPHLLKRDTTDTVMAWILFPILGIEIFLACSVVVGYIYQYLTDKRKVKDTYAGLPHSEKEKIHALQKNWGSFGPKPPWSLKIYRRVGGLE